jgi:hypothetical protein
MRAPRRRIAGLTAASLAGTSALVLGLSAGSASAADTRYSLFAQGDSQYYQLDGEDIPASPKNSAGSLTAQAQTDSTGQTTSFAGAPYYGKTAQTAPGTVNGVPNQFGYGQLQLPISQFPGYVTASYPSSPKADDSNYYYKVHAEADENGAKASGSNGAPDSVPAPNQQQVAGAVVQKLADGTTVTDAEGAASGFVQGPLEVGYSDAKAIIKDAGAAPKIESSVFGKFSIGGQAFGYNKSGFEYLGQSADKKSALDSANAALKAAGIELEVAPETTATDPTSGITNYILGGLQVTSTFTSPTGAKYTVGYILGRVQVASVNTPVTAAVATSVTHSAATMGGISPDVKASVTRSAPAIAASSQAVRSALLKPAVAAERPAPAGAAPAVVAPAASEPVPMPPLHLAAVKKPTATSDEGLYGMLLLGGLAIFAVPALSVLGGRRKG